MLQQHPTLGAKTTNTAHPLLISTTDNVTACLFQKRLLWKRSNVQIQTWRETRKDLLSKTQENLHRHKCTFHKNTQTLRQEYGLRDSCSRTKAQKSTVHRPLQKFRGILNPVNRAWRVCYRPKNDCVPEHDIVVQRRAANASRWIMLQTVEVAHQLLLGRRRHGDAPLPVQILQHLLLIIESKAKQNKMILKLDSKTDVNHSSCSCSLFVSLCLLPLVRVVFLCLSYCIFALRPLTLACHRPLCAR